jgi:hypothetical protein
MKLPDVVKRKSTVREEVQDSIAGIVLAADWVVWGWNPSGGEIFRTHPEWSGCPPVSVTVGTKYLPQS